MFFIRHFLVSHQPGSDSVVFWLNTVIFVAMPMALVICLLYFRLAWLVRWMEKLSLLGRLLSYIRVLENFNATVLLRILSLSVMRYLVFVGQYYLLFQVFDVELNIWQVFWAVSVVFLVLAIVPTIALFTELGIRWKASIELVQLFSTNVVGILATSLAIWIINLVIPALIGSLLILGVRIFNNRDEASKSIPPEAFRR